MVPVVPRVGCLLVRLVAFRLVCVLMVAYSLFLLRLPLCKLWLRQRSKFLLRARWLLMDPRLNGLVRSAWKLLLLLRPLLYSGNDVFIWLSMFRLRFLRLLFSLHVVPS